MLGNVQEWTASLWGTQPAQPQQTYRDRPDGGPTILDPGDLPAQARLVHRGGSYKSQPDELRCSARGSAAPDSRIPWRGFRVAMEV
jgi:formylglycine-generating enzyme required for sulfatase activity